MEEVEVLSFDDIPERSKKRKTKRKLKKPVKIALIFIITIVIGFTASLVTYNYMLSSPSKTNETIEFTIEKGDTVYGVGKRLEDEGIIRNFLAYKVYVKLNGISEYKAGTYELNTNYNTKKIVESLKGSAIVKGVTMTFKEGKTMRSVAKTIAENTNVTEEEFFKILEDETYIDSLISKYWFLTDEIKNKDIYYPLEGYLFAETYTFGENPGVKEIIEFMLDQTDKVLTKYKSDIEKSDYTIHELVTLASMIESEGIYESDRKLISSVFYNRLKINMQLGSDVTTYYAFKVDMSERDLTKAELNTYNPYNTRGPKMDGKLPVGPISNFSKSSIEAAIYPDTSDYYFFVADKKGKTHFTKNYSEHLKKINELKSSGNWITWD